MKEFWLNLLFNSITRLIGQAAWNEVMTNIRAAELMPGFSGEAKKRYVMERLKWLIEDLRKGYQSRSLQTITHILISVAVDIAVAKLRIGKES
jgi:hypothetical protein